MNIAEPYLAEPDHAVSDAALDTIFRDARTLRQWQNKPVSPALLMAIYDLMRWGPTETNITPARFHFVVSKAAKARLEPLLDESNRTQTMAAPAGRTGRMIRGAGRFHGSRRARACGRISTSRGWGGILM